MSIYDTPVDKLTTPDLEELLTAGAVENVRLEFKREMPGPDETLKKLSSFANTYGGYLVVGADAPSDDGRLAALDGIDPVPNVRQTIIQRCAGGITPLIQPFVSDAIPAPGGAGAAGKVCYVVHVPESEAAPHFLNNRRGAYVRTDEHSKRYEPRLATADELLHLVDRRRLAAERRDALVRRAAARFSQYAAADYQTAPSTRLGEERLPSGLGATMHLALAPRFPVTPLCESATVLRVVREQGIHWRHVGFPRPGTPISQHESALLTNAGGGFSLLEVNTWGLVSYVGEVQRVLTPQSGGGPMNGIHLNSMLGHVLAVLEYARGVYDALGFEGGLEVSIAFQRVRGVAIYAFPNNFPEEVGASRFDDEVRFGLTVPTDRLRTARDAVGADLLHAALFALGWSNAGRAGEEGPLTRQLLESAYDYNFWSHPGA